MNISAPSKAKWATLFTFRLTQQLLLNAGGTPVQVPPKPPLPSPAEALGPPPLAHLEDIDAIFDTT